MSSSAGSLSAGGELCSPARSILARKCMQYHCKRSNGRCSSCPLPPFRRWTPPLQAPHTLPIHSRKPTSQMRLAAARLLLLAAALAAAAAAPTCVPPADLLDTPTTGCCLDQPPAIDAGSSPAFISGVLAHFAYPTSVRGWPVGFVPGALPPPLLPPRFLLSTTRCSHLCSLPGCRSSPLSMPLALTVAWTSRRRSRTLQSRSAASKSRL